MFFRILKVIFTALILCGAGGGCGGSRIRPTSPGRQWAHLPAGRAGFDIDRMTAFVTHVGGTGCIVRYGRMVHQWGHYAHPLDVASATKVVYAHLIYAAIRAGLIENLDSPVSRFEPGLTRLNEPLGFKDAGITWRHLITQTACYGVEEKPGTAFNYSDYQMALLIDALVFKVYGTGYYDVDRRILDPSLTRLLQCQDRPTLNGATSLPGRLRISARDFARFGLLYLQAGEWRRRRVIAREHAVRAIGTPVDVSMPRTQQVAADMLPKQRTIGSGENQERHMNSYSYGWWLNGVDKDGTRVLPDVSADAFLAQGHAGHDALIVIPSLDLVVCWIDAFEGNPATRYSVDGHQRVNTALKLLLKSIHEADSSEGG